MYLDGIEVLLYSLKVANIFNSATCRCKVGLREKPPQGPVLISAPCSLRADFEMNNSSEIYNKSL